MKSWLSYAGVGLLLTLIAAAVATGMVAPDVRIAVWFSAGLAYLLQLLAFGAVIALRDRPQLFLIGWVSGILLRFLALGVVAFWLTRTRVWPAETVLLSLVSFVVLLLFLEPMFLRRGRA